MRTHIVRDGDPAAQATTAANSTQKSLSRFTCFQHIASRCLQMIESNRELAVAADPEAVHRMRIEL